MSKLLSYIGGKVNHLEINPEDFADRVKDLQQRNTLAGREIERAADLARDQAFDDPAKIGAKT